MGNAVTPVTLTAMTTADGASASAVTRDGTAITETSLDDETEFDALGEGAYVEGYLANTAG